MAHTIEYYSEGATTTSPPSSPYVEVLVPDTDFNSGATLIQTNFKGIQDRLDSIDTMPAKNLGASNPQVVITENAAGVQITSTALNWNDATSNGFAGSGGSGDTLLYFDYSNSAGFGSVWLLYSNAWGGGQVYATGSSSFGQPEGVYTAVNSSGITISLVFDGTTPWQINSVGFTDPLATGIADPVSFTCTTNSYTLDGQGNFSGNAATASAVQLLTELPSSTLPSSDGFCIENAGSLSQLVWAHSGNKFVLTNAGELSVNGVAWGVSSSNEAYFDKLKLNGIVRATSNAGLTTGQVWADTSAGNVLKIV